MTTTATTAATDPVAAPSTLTDEQVKFYKDEGYLILPGLISPEEASLLKTEVMDIMAVIGLGMTKLKQSREYPAGSHLDAFVNSPNLLAIASRLMEGPSTLYLPFTAVKSGGGGGEFHYHQDNQYTRFDGPGINLWFALMPMTEQNGCLNVVPRSHRNGTLPSHSPENDGHKAVTFEPEEFVPILMQPGDCVAFSRLTVHGSGPNTTPEHRVAYAAQFHRDDGNYSLDSGVTWQRAKDNPRWSVGPVAAITPPQGKLDGH
jgi:2-oxoglutarate-dependent dioxygenase